LPLGFLKPRLVNSGATVIIPLHDCVFFVSTFNSAELFCWFSEITQTLDAVTGSQFRAATRGLIKRWVLCAI